ncbi:MAG: mechanosensitive ion channel family protein [Bacteroidota bacterium]|nr:mechanosensitive ion channel family protein [Bacteroidota bacterium]
MDFLEQVYFDNTVKNYLLVAGTILLAIILKKFLSRYIATLFYLPVKKFSKNIDKRLFINLVVEPLEILLVLLISFLAIDKLYFPKLWIVNVYHVTSKQIIESIIIGIIILSVIWVVLRLIDFIVVVLQHRDDTEPSQNINQVILFFRDFLKVIIIIVGGVIILKFCFNAHIGNLITGLSIVGAALALAAKESLENLIASFIIFFDKPFGAGDLVKVNNYLGFVERIGLRSTRIRTFDRTLVVVPNKQMVDSIVDNWSMRSLLRNEIRVELAPQTSSEKIELAVTQIKNILKEKKDVALNSSVFLMEITKNSAMIIAEFFTSSALSIYELNKLKEDLNLEIKKMQENNDIKSAVANSFTFIKE